MLFVLHMTTELHHSQSPTFNGLLIPIFASKQFGMVKKPWVIADWVAWFSAATHNKQTYPGWCVRPLLILEIVKDGLKKAKAFPNCWVQAGEIICYRLIGKQACLFPTLRSQVSLGVAWERRWPLSEPIQSSHGGMPSQPYHAMLCIPPSVFSIYIYMYTNQ